MEIIFKIEYLKVVVQKHIPALSPEIKPLIKRAIEQKLTLNPIGFGKPLRYSLKGHRRLRIQDWRIVYRIDSQRHTVVVVAIKHRKDIYASDS